MNNGSDLEANALLASLTAGTDFAVPVIDLSGAEFTIPGLATSDLYDPVIKLTIADLTTGVDGTGVFDAIMKSFAAHLKTEYTAGRITGAEYTKAFAALVESAMGGAVQYLLGKDQAYWAGQNAQIAAITARVNLETAKVNAAAMQNQAATAQATYALTKLKLATEDAQYGTAEYQLDTLLPQQFALLKEQTEAQRAQTMNTRTNGDPVVGTLGMQRDLSAQQITSYQRSSQLNAVKAIIDTWITQKTIDEGLTAPVSLQNASVNTAVTALLTTNGLD